MPPPVEEEYIPATDQQYKVKWSGHKSRLLEYVSQLQYDQSTSDATLVSQGGVKYKVHRVVLASASPFFKELFEVSWNNDDIFLLFLLIKTLAEITIIDC